LLPTYGEEGLVTTLYMLLEAE